VSWDFSATLHIQVSSSLSIKLHKRKYQTYCWCRFSFVYLLNNTVFFLSVGAACTNCGGLCPQTSIYNLEFLGPVKLALNTFDFCFTLIKMLVSKISNSFQTAIVSRMFYYYSKFFGRNITKFVKDITK